MTFITNLELFSAGEVLLIITQKGAIFSLTVGSLTEQTVKINTLLAYNILI